MEKVAEGFKGEKAIVTPYNIRNLQRENNITKQLFVSHIGYYYLFRWYLPWEGYSSDTIG